MLRTGKGHRRARVRALVGAIVAGAPAAALAAPGVAQEPPPLVTDRPDQTESATAVAGGLLQLELGWTHAREEVGGTRRLSHAVPSTLVRLGLGAGVEARVGFSGWIFEREEADDGVARPSTEGVGDAELGLKWVLSDGDAGAVALLGSASLPVGADGLSSGRVDPSLRLALARDVGERASVGVNLGVARETTPGESGAPTSRTDVLYTAALGFEVSGRVGAFVESFGFIGLPAGRPDRHLVDGGLTFLLLRTLQLDASAGLGISAAAEDWFVGAGAAVRLPR